MIVKLLTEHHLEFLGLKVGSRGSSESTHVKMSNCWKSHALAHIYLNVKRELQHFHVLVLNTLRDSVSSGRIQDFWKGGSYV